MLSLTNADTLSIFSECAFLLGFALAITSAIVAITPEKTNPPTIIPKHAMTRSTRVVALISPYPTVVMVVNAQYMLAMYLSHTSRPVG